MGCVNDLFSLSLFNSSPEEAVSCCRAKKRLVGHGGMGEEEGAGGWVGLGIPAPLEIPAWGWAGRWRQWQGPSLTLKKRR